MIKLFLVKDNLIGLKEIKDGTVDHFIFDPLFNSNRNYVGTPDDKGSVQSMRDVFIGGSESYKENMGCRIDEMKRCLKPVGSIILQCDETMCFGLEHVCRNRGLYLRCKIIWSYSGGGLSKHDPPNKHDYIMVFSNIKDKDKYIYNPIYRQYSVGTKSRPSHSKTSGGAELDLDRGTPLTRVWDVREEQEARVLAEINKDPWVFNPDFGSIAPVPSLSEKAITEKPLALYKRLVYMFTNEGDLIVDPFMGGGTTLVAAESLGRNSIGMDQDLTAYNRTVKRCRDNELPYEENEVKSYVNVNSNLLNELEWQKFMIELDGGTSNPKRTGDHGIDGWDHGKQVLYSCKKGTAVAEHVRNLLGSAEVFANTSGWNKDDGVTLKIIAHGKDGKDPKAFTRGAHTEKSRIKNSVSWIKDVVFITDQELERCFVDSKPIIINLFGPKNKKILARIEGPARKIIKYTWYIEYQTTKILLFGLTPPPIIKQTSVPELDLQDININKFNYLKLEVITSDGQKFIKDMRIN